MRHYQNEPQHMYMQHILPYDVPAVRAGPSGGWGGT